MKHLTRILDREKPCWLVTVEIGKKVHSRFFWDVEHGSNGSALKAAKAYRNKLLGIEEGKRSERR